MRIKKGDQVKILAGRDRGKTGTVLRVFPEQGKISIEGMNLHKKRAKPKAQGKKGETVLVPRPFPASRVAILCGSCKRGVRVGIRVEGGKKERVCKKCGALVGK
mgnify:FL=1